MIKKTSVPPGTLGVQITDLGTLTDREGGSAVWVEFHDGKWWVRVWADINQEDPTHNIALSGALESAREEDA